ncbi:MAG: sulfurtransferase TusA family protein [Gammaproteobacteria bacterium]|nr:sulfurtransferase TusA family protein [Gammaproteobacteria bacterium]MBI5782904.1 sulfurtransferase TusA family protein [Gammaproteobacteria bacterium]
MNTVTLDCTGLNCPIPILRLSKAVKQLKAGERLEMTATDPGSVKDVQAWSQQTGNTLVESRQEQEKYKFIVEKAA